MQHQNDYKAALKYPGVRVDAVQIWSNGPRDRLPCLSVCSSHTSVSPHHSHTSITLSPLHSSPLFTPRICSSLRPPFIHLRLVYFHTSPPLLISPPFSPLSLCGFFSPPRSLSLSPSLPRCVKWKLSQRPEVAIVTCQSNHSPSCVSPSRRRGLGASVALQLPKRGVSSVKPCCVVGKFLDRICFRLTKLPDDNISEGADDKTAVFCRSL